MTVGEFPGVSEVLLSHAKLRTVIRELHPTWRGFLEHVAGVYVITDVTTGKQYVGSACGIGGIWQRWTAYAMNGHGGNQELVELLKEKGAEHMKSFQYAILEVCDLNTGEKEVHERESHWKDVLRTREFGLNSN
jgi:hypothetical protein